ncbi:MAG TPA: hypothetical protein VE398_02960 [Acidobacteriota bacterium]|nr:hypothetical protein [Acidobacteriota bacterium]
MRKVLGCVLLTSVVVLGAGKLSGKWSGSFDISSSDGESHPDSAFMVLKENGGTVEGTAGPNADEQMEIRNGKLDGDKLTFEVVKEGGTIKFDLVFEGDSIKGTAEGQRPDGVKMTAKLDLKRAE